MAEFIFEGKQIYYELHGGGRPLLLLNGIMMSCGSWAEFVEPLSAQNQLILLDMLDQGRSAKMTEPYDHSVQIRLVHALLDHLGLDKVCIAGISYGSEIGLEYAIAVSYTHLDVYKRQPYRSTPSSPASWAASPPFTGRSSALCSFRWPPAASASWPTFRPFPEYRAGRWSLSMC